MRRSLRYVDARVLPAGWFDPVRQIALFVIAYMGYQAVRGIVDGNVGEASWNATKIIDLEHSLKIFVEPSVQAWATSTHWLIGFADWMYLNSHYTVSISALVFLYFCRNDSFYFVRNMFMVAMLLALVGYALYPTAPPRLMPEWGFSDSVADFTGVKVEYEPANALLNLYAAVPSMHCGFALMIGGSMAKLVKRRYARVLWSLYPLLVTFVVVATGNHYLTDAFLGCVTAGIAMLVAKHVLARLRPDVWSWTGRRERTVRGHPAASEPATVPVATQAAS